MSFLKDIIGFESFNAKDMWKKVRKDPERLLLGAVDPFATRMWNQTGIGKDWEPIVDQMGGAYGGSALTLGDTGEGVYGRARAAGVPTAAGAGMQDLAHVIAGMFAGNYGAGKLPGGVGGGGMQLPGGKGQQQQPQQPIPMSFMPRQPGTLPTGMAQALSPRNNQMALLAALLRGRNG